MDEFLVLENQVLFAHFVHIVSTILSLLLKALCHGLFTDYMVDLVLHLMYVQSFLLLFVDSGAFCFVIQSIKNTLTLILRVKSLSATLVALAWIKISISELLVDVISPSLRNRQPLLSHCQLLINGGLVDLLCLVLIDFTIVYLYLMLGCPSLPHSELVNLWFMLWLLHIKRYMIHAQVLRLGFHSL